jgi:hypothetical protein
MSLRSSRRVHRRRDSPTPRTEPGSRGGQCEQSWLDSDAPGCGLANVER